MILAGGSLEEKLWKGSLLWLETVIILWISLITLAST